MTELLTLLLFLVLSGFFSGSETALTSLSAARAEALLKEGRPGAKALMQLKSNTTRMLVIILIGNNLVNIGASALATVLATNLLGHFGPGVAVGLLTIFILVFGEVTPKSWAAKNAEKASLFCAPLILNFGRLVLPAAWALEKISDWLHERGTASNEPSVTESEVISLLEHGAEEGTIEAEERKMIERVFAFNDLTVRDVMTPRNQVYALDENRTVREALPEILSHSLSRIPLYRNGMDDVRGLVHLHDILQAVVEDQLDQPLKQVAQDPLFAPQSQPIDELFAGLKHGNRHLAMVVNEYGMFQGVVTLEDLIEELVGEIYDETDKPKNLIRDAGPHRIIADGQLEMRVVAEHFDREIPGKPTDTVSFWILHHVARIPTAGEEFEIDGFTVRVEQATERSICSVSILRPEPAPETVTATADSA